MSVRRIHYVTYRLPREAGQDAWSARDFAADLRDRLGDAVTAVVPVLLVAAVAPTAWTLPAVLVEEHWHAPLCLETTESWTLELLAHRLQERHPPRGLVELLINRIPLPATLV